MTEFLEFWSCKRFGEDVSDHIISGAINEHGDFRVDSLLNEMKTSVDVFGKGMESGVL